MTEMLYYVFLNNKFVKFPNLLISLCLTSNRYVYLQKSKGAW